MADGSQRLTILVKSCAKMDGTSTPPFPSSASADSTADSTAASSLSNQAAQHIASQLVAPSSILKFDRLRSNLRDEPRQLPIHFSTSSLATDRIPNGMDKRHPSSFQQLEKVSCLSILLMLPSADTLHSSVRVHMLRYVFIYIIHSRD